MKNIINIFRIASIVFAVLYFLWGTDLFGVIFIISTVIMFLLSAYSHYRQNKELDISFWSSIIIAIFAVLAIVIKSFL